MGRMWVSPSMRPAISGHLSFMGGTQNFETRAGMQSMLSFALATIEERVLPGRLSGNRKAKMSEGLSRQHAAARRARDEALLQQIRLDDLFDRVTRFGQACGDRLDADRAAPIIDRNQTEIAVVERIEPFAVHLKLRQG